MLGTSEAPSSYRASRLGVGLLHTESMQVCDPPLLGAEAGLAQRARAAAWLGASKEENQTFCYAESPPFLELTKVSEASCPNWRQGAGGWLHSLSSRFLLRAGSIGLCQCQNHHQADQQRCKGLREGKGFLHSLNVWLHRLDEMAQGLFRQSRGLGWNFGRSVHSWVICCIACSVITQCSRSPRADKCPQMKRSGANLAD